MIISLDPTLLWDSSGQPGNLGRAILHPAVASGGAPLFGLAPGGVYPASPVTGAAVRSYRTFSPLPLDSALAGLARGGMFSVALSLGSPPVGVTDHPALRSPDFPPRSLRGERGDHLALSGQCQHTPSHQVIQEMRS